MIKIKKNTPELLVVEDRSFIIHYLLWVGLAVSIFSIYKGLSGGYQARKAIIGGSIGTIICLSGIELLCVHSIFWFDRVSEKVVWLRKGLFKKEQGAVSLSEIQRARRESSRDTDGITYRVVLELKDQSLLPLTKHFSGVDHCEAVAESICLWLKGSKNLGVKSKDEGAFNETLSKS